MGSADIVPGVSGGTVALVLNIYHQLIKAIHQCVTVITTGTRGDLSGAVREMRRVPWVWLLSLLAGILTAVIVLSKPLETALHEHPVELAGLFLGLIAGSVVLCWGQVREPSVKYWLIGAISAVITFVVLGFSAGNSDSAGITAAWWVFFLSGAIAICAMILPGISGSFILVLLGMYGQVLSAVTDRNILILAVFALGCATGLALASSTQNWLLSNHHDAVIAAMVGLMAGSLRILWPWPGGLDSTALGLPGPGEVLLPVALAVLGLAIVIGMDMASRRVRTGH